jgi:hypothetical protein
VLICYHEVVKETFAEVLSVGKPNSLGRADEVVQEVLADKKRLDELYECIFADDAWIRMRAIDSFEKICRVHPEWVEAYGGKILKDLTSSTQPSIQWHLAEIFNQIQLSPSQQKAAIKWMKDLVSTSDVDWIVSANTMDTLAQFTRDNKFSQSKLIELLQVQLKHKSKAVVKRASKLMSEFEV